MLRCDRRSSLARRASSPARAAAACSPGRSPRRARCRRARRCWQCCPTRARATPAKSVSYPSFARLAHGAAGERYLSTPLFDDVPADMTAEEKALAAQAPPTAAYPQALPEA